MTDFAPLPRSARNADDDPGRRVARLARRDLQDAATRLQILADFVALRAAEPAD